MQQLWPPVAPDVEAKPLTDDELAEIYAYPPHLTGPYLRVNFVSSVDGAMTIDGVSGGLSSPADRRVFGLLRGLCEVILVGAGTVRAEKYAAARKPSRVTGLPPRIAVVTRSADLDPSGPMFTEMTVPTLVLTSPDAPAETVSRLVHSGAEVDRRGTSPADLVSALRDRGMHRVLCEGGPSVFGQLIAADAVDELCLTMTPQLLAGSAGRIASARSSVANRMRLATALTDEDVLLLRYERVR